jgi:hypothetical protein
MRWVKLFLSLAVFVPARALLGAFATFDSGAEHWKGLLVGSLIGVFFGLVFGGVRGGIVGIMYPPGDEDEKNKTP